MRNGAQVHQELLEERLIQPELPPQLGDLLFRDRRVADDVGNRVARSQPDQKEVDNDNNEDNSQYAEASSANEAIEPAGIIRKISTAVTGPIAKCSTGP